MKKHLLIPIMVGFAVIVGGFYWRGFYQGAPISQNSQEIIDYAVEEEDCLSGETYDPQEKVCYFTCETEAECAAIEAQTAAEAEEIGDDYFEDEKDYIDLDEKQDQTLVSYALENDKLGETEFSQVSENLVSWQNDRPKHEELWNLFSRLIPLDYRPQLLRFEIVTDGKEGTLAAVYQVENDPYKWVLAVDILDAFDKSRELIRDDVIYSFIHEYGHILTLNSSQVRVDLELFNLQGDEQKLKLVVAVKEKACQPRYLVDEGCSLANSYINKFFKKFWKDNFEQKQAEDFYSTNPHEFVTEYAATNPAEDIAESWTAFVLKNRPNGSVISDQKTTFFYDFSELVKMRTLIRNRI